MATRLFVGNLPKNTEEKDLRSAFGAFGEITHLDLKNKPGNEESTKFAFVTLSASNYYIESCIKHFSSENFNGSRLYVTRARESFLERLQRERQQAQNKEDDKLFKKNDKVELPKNPVINLGDKLTPHKRQYDKQIESSQQKHTEPTNDIHLPTKINKNHINNTKTNKNHNDVNPPHAIDKKKLESDMKRLESLKIKRQEFKQKQNIIKTGLTGIDKGQKHNQKIIFSDDELDSPKTNNLVKEIKSNNKNTLFNDDDEDSDNALNFEIKKQFEGKKGQKVLDLQSRYKSDKRFVLDERFIDEEKSDNDKEEDEIELEQTDEKSKQLDILQNVLGVTLKRKMPEDEKDSKKKPKLGMLRFDPSQPEHAKFLAPIEEKLEPPKKSKKKLKDKIESTLVDEPKPEEVRPEVSKEQFYKVSETLKEAIAQPTQFSLRSLFGNSDNVEDESKTDDAAPTYIPIEPKKKSKVKHPLDTGEKNPFVYDSSDSEEEIEDATVSALATVVENKAVWKESLFFVADDQRLKDGLDFFNNTSETEAQKERRELKSIMKKRIYNNERKNQMFRKKIGGRKKTMKKSFHKRN